MFCSLFSRVVLACLLIMIVSGWSSAFGQCGPFGCQTPPAGGAYAQAAYRLAGAPVQAAGAAWRVSTAPARLVFGGMAERMADRQDRRLARRAGGSCGSVTVRTQTSVVVAPPAPPKVVPMPPAKPPEKTPEKKK